MQATIPTDKLKATVARLSKSVTKTIAIPVFTSLEFQCRGGKTLVVSATSLDHLHEIRLDDVVTREGAAFSIPYSKLNSFLNCAKAEFVTLDAEGTIEKAESVTMIAGSLKLKVAAGEPSYFNLDPGKRECTISLPPGELSRMLDRTRWTVGIDDTRRILTGICLDVDEAGSLIAVATDGKSMAMYEVGTATAAAADEKHPRSAAVIHPRAFDALATMSPIQTVGIEVGKKAIVFRNGDTTITVKRPEGNYPNWRQVVPREIRYRIKPKGAEKELAPFVKLLKSLTTDDLRCDFTVVEGGLVLRYDRGNDTVDTMIPTGEADAGALGLDFTLNPERLVNVLKSCKGGCTWGLNENQVNCPVLFDWGNGYRALLMPIRTK